MRMLSRFLPKLPLSSGQLAAAAALYFTLACNGPFLDGALAGRSWAQASTWGFAAALLVVLAAIHLLVLGLLLHGRAARPVLAVLIVGSAAATYYMQRYGIFLDPSMLRNVLRTDWGEARELLGLGLAVHLLLYAGLPLLVLWRVRLVPAPLKRQAATRRLALLGFALVAAVAPLWLVFQDVSALMRNQRELRYLITPENYLYSAVRVMTADSVTAAHARTVVAPDARMGSPVAGAKPRLLVLMVGETARAANWGLNGYARQTTPELARLDVVNFTDVTSCGSNTETSLPCMFSAVGRRNYDEQRIRGSESLLHVLARAGYAVRWIDNQSGCKGVCDGIGEQRAGVLPGAAASAPAKPNPALCDEERCLDEVLLQSLEAAAAQATGPQVLVLHMLGNHGPAYYRRHPASMRRFTPTCDTPELQKCSREQIVNSYDNALLYTDTVLAQAVRLLDSQAGRFDTGLLYVSDHGESLGERGLFLHGMPYAIAPAEQTRVPMVWWLSKGLQASAGVDHGCLQAQAGRAWSHDNLFHSVLGLLDVQTSVYEPALDVAAPCRALAAQAGPVRRDTPELHADIADRR